MQTQRKSKILELLYGKIFTYSERVDDDEEVKKCISKLAYAENILIEKIKNNEELKKLFEEYQNVSAMKSISETDLYFVEGFKTGLLIGIETGEWASNKFKK